VGEGDREGEVVKMEWVGVMRRMLRWAEQNIDNAAARL
jgi:hypothetical protein